MISEYCNNKEVKKLFTNKYNFYSSIRAWLDKVDRDIKLDNSQKIDITRTLGDIRDSGIACYDVNIYVLIHNYYILNSIGKKEDIKLYFRPVYNWGDLKND